MTVEIWSDIMCPFCYIGKRRFESALHQFSNKDSVDIVWKSFQLNPGMKTEPDKNINQYLADVKGWSYEQAEQMNDRVTQMAKAVGLDYDFDKAVVANSFKAHQLIHLAASHGLGDAAEESLFNAYFTQGKNVDDPAVLVELGTAIGLKAEEITTALQTNAYAEEVRQDQQQAQQIGARGVPFFVFNRKYAVSGAQPEEVFLQALQQSWQEEKPVLLSSQSDSCDVEGEC